MWHFPDLFFGLFLRYVWHGFVLQHVCNIVLPHWAITFQGQIFLRFFLNHQVSLCWHYFFSSCQQYFLLLDDLLFASLKHGNICKFCLFAFWISSLVIHSFLKNVVIHFILKWITCSSQSIIQVHSDHPHSRHEKLPWIQHKLDAYISYLVNSIIK